MTHAGPRVFNADSRGVPRYSAYHDLAITYEGHSEDVPVRVPDVSTKGIFLNTTMHFPEGAVLTVQFSLTRSGVTIKARGEVRYCLAGVGVGVEFIDISPEDARAIEDEMSGTGGSFQAGI